MSCCDLLIYAQLKDKTIIVLIFLKIFIIIHRLKKTYGVCLYKIQKLIYDKLYFDDEIEMFETLILILLGFVYSFI